MLKHAVSFLSPASFEDFDLGLECIRVSGKQKHSFVGVQLIIILIND